MCYYPVQQSQTLQGCLGERERVVEKRGGLCVRLSINQARVWRVFGGRAVRTDVIMDDRCEAGLKEAEWRILWGIQDLKAG